MWYQFGFYSQTFRLAKITHVLLARAYCANNTTDCLGSGCLDTSRPYWFGADIPIRFPNFHPSGWALAALPPKMIQTDYSSGTPHPIGCIIIGYPDLESGTIPIRVGEKNLEESVFWDKFCFWLSMEIDSFKHQFSICICHKRTQVSEVQGDKEGARARPRDSSNKHCT